jgi:hypothetical protein
MRLGNVLREIVKEASIIEHHMNDANASPEFLTQHADMLSDYAQLLRDLALTEETTSKRRQSTTTQH